MANNYYYNSKKQQQQQEKIKSEYENGGTHVCACTMYYLY